MSVRDVLRGSPSATVSVLRSHLTMTALVCGLIRPQPIHVCGLTRTKPLQSCSLSRPSLSLRDPTKPYCGPARYSLSCFLGPCFFCLWSIMTLRFPSPWFILGQDGVQAPKTLHYKYKPLDFTGWRLSPCGYAVS